MLHSISMPLKVWNQISTDIIGELSEIDDYRYTVTPVDYASKYVEAYLLKRKLVRLLYVGRMWFTAYSVKCRLLCSLHMLIIMVYCIHDIC